MIAAFGTPLDAPRRPARAGLAVALAFWGVCVSVGLGVLAGHAATPGARGATPGVWPVASGLSGPAGRARVVVFVHPKCPCTIATLHEVARAGVAGVRADVTFVVLQPAGGRWEVPGALEEARAALGADVRDDPGGVEAARFGVWTSGHVLAYGGNGVKVFDGGVVPERGHEGSNAGREALAAVLGGAAGAARRTEVYGCSMGTGEACGGGVCEAK